MSQELALPHFRLPGCRHGPVGIPGATATSARHRRLTRGFKIRPIWRYQIFPIACLSFPLARSKARRWVVSHFFSAPSFPRPPRIIRLISSGLRLPVVTRVLTNTSGSRASRTTRVFRRRGLADGLHRRPIQDFTGRLGRMDVFLDGDADQSCHHVMGLPIGQPLFSDDGIGQVAGRRPVVRRHLPHAVLVDDQRVKDPGHVVQGVLGHVQRIVHFVNFPGRDVARPFRPEGSERGGRPGRRPNRPPF